MPASISSGGGGGGGSGGVTGKSAAQGSFRKIGGAWRRVGGWGGKGGKGTGSSPPEGEAGAKEDKEQREEPSSEAEMDVPLPQVDHARCEFSLLSMMSSTMEGCCGNSYVGRCFPCSLSQGLRISSSLPLRVEGVYSQPCLPLNRPRTVFLPWGSCFQRRS